jgi:hypothetical protein
MKQIPKKNWSKIKKSKVKYILLNKTNIFTVKLPPSKDSHVNRFRKFLKLKKQDSISKFLLFQDKLTYYLVAILPDAPDPENQDGMVPEDLKRRLRKSKTLYKYLLGLTGTVLASMLAVSWYTKKPEDNRQTFDQQENSNKQSNAIDVSNRELRADDFAPNTVMIHQFPGNVYQVEAIGSDSISTIINVPPRLNRMVEPLLFTYLLHSYYNGDTIKSNINHVKNYIYNYRHHVFQKPYEGKAWVNLLINNTLSDRTDIPAILNHVDSLYLSQVSSEVIQHDKRNPYFFDLMYSHENIFLQDSYNRFY